MWVVLKYNKNELNFLKQDFKKALGELPIIFQPKIRYQKLIRHRIIFLEKNILDDYLICYHEKFKGNKTLEILNNLRGLKYFLEGSNNNQREIISFVNCCKKNQDKNGYIKQSFFEFQDIKKGIFMNGPFTNMIFTVIENKKDKLKVLIGNMKTTLTKNSNFLYRSV